MPHINEKIDFTVTVYVFYKDKVLLRMHDKYKFWGGAGGHIELDEDPNQAAIRETKEEVGLDVELVGKRVTAMDKPGTRSLIPPRFMDIHPINDTHQHMNMTYFGTAKSDKVKLERSNDEVRWLTKEGVEAMKGEMIPGIFHYVMTGFEEVVLAK